MSDYFIRFIPENIDTKLSWDEIKQIEKMNWCGNSPKIIINEKIQFADAGQNFESVRCPSCKANLMEWWGSAMSSAYSEEHGFVDLEITTPCCNMTTSLHRLEYSFPQGFYKIMIEVTPELDSQIAAERIADDLLDITGGSWRIIHAHY